MKILKASDFTQMPTMEKKRLSQEDKFAFHDALLKTNIRITQNLIDISDCCVPQTCVIANALSSHFPTESSNYQWVVQAQFSNVAFHETIRNAVNKFYPKFLHHRQLIWFIKGFDAEVRRYYDQEIKPINLGVKFVECDDEQNKKDLALIFREHVGFASYHKYLDRVINRDLPKTGFYMLYIKK